MRTFAFALLLLVAPLAAGSASATRADNPVLTGDVGAGDAFSISLKDSTGAAVRTLDPGTYTLVVNDHSALHNFQLFGPGVDVSSSVGEIGTFTFTITLANGTYTYVCDEHPTTMKGSFTVGTVSTPPPAAAPTKLLASVGPGAKIALRAANGSALSRLSAGSFTVVVADRSARDNFHLVGSGVSKATGVAFTGSVTWKLTLKAGAYTFRSDRHPALHGAFRLKPA